ncbi:hypothetical protein JCM3770_005168 [Rhodotorula araucariae]
MSSSESEQEPDLIFDGLTMLVHGPNSGRTRGQLIKAIESNGGNYTKHETSNYLTHVILSHQLWSRQGTVGADGLVRRVMAANAENRTEKDPNYNRVWLLPLEWLDDSIAKGRRLPELQYDFERTADQTRMAREQDIRRERAANKGKSKFGRGERRRHETEQRVKQELALQAKIDKEGAALDGDEAFSGVAASASSPAPANPVASPSLAASTPDVGRFKLDMSTPVTPNASGAEDASSSTKMEDDAPPEAGPSSRPEQIKPRKDDVDVNGFDARPPPNDGKKAAEKPPCEPAKSESSTNRLAPLPVIQKLSTSSTSAQSQPNPSTAILKPKPKPKPNRTFIKPVANPALKNKSSMYGNIRRPAPKAPSAAAAAPAKANGASSKDKGKGRATGTEIVELSSSYDEPLSRKTAKAGSKGGAKDKKGKKRAVMLSSEDDGDTLPEKVKASGASTSRKRGKKMQLSSSELSSLEDD